MTTIRVMACSERASLNAHATKATTGLTSPPFTASLVTAFLKGAESSTAGTQSNQRASNAGGLPHAITENNLKV